MIDYLERIFAPEQRKEEGKPEEFFRFSPLEAEPGQEMRLPALNAEPVEEIPVSSMEREAFWQIEGLRRIGEALTPSGAGTYRLSPSDPEELARVGVAREEPVDADRNRLQIHRSQPGTETRELERRLRRDSRRYDSGFFWY